jgi:hypothetical protein
MTAIAVIGLCAAVVVLVILAAPQARSGCPAGQRAAVTGHAKVTIGGAKVAVPVYGCEAP